MRQKITQSIPIVNNGGEEWQLTAAITGSKSFTGPGQLKVAPGDEFATYEITYRPVQVGEEEGKLTLRNAKAAFSFDYTTSRRTTSRRTTSRRSHPHTHLVRQNGCRRLETKIPHLPHLRRLCEVEIRNRATAWINMCGRVDNGVLTLSELWVWRF